MSPSDQPRETLVSLQDASADYGQHSVLRAINLHLHKDEKVVLLGRSGAGKSTLLKLLYENLRGNNESVAWIPQDLGLVSPLSIFHNVLIGRLEQQSGWRNLRNLIFPESLHQKNIQALLNRLLIPNPLFDAVACLSGGQQQRVAIARALYQPSQYLLADEPVANLDQPLAKKALSLLSAQFDGFVIALHDVELALSVADRVIAIKDGRILLDQATDEIDAQQLASVYHQQQQH